MSDKSDSDSESSITGLRIRERTKNIFTLNTVKRKDSLGSEGLSRSPGGSFKSGVNIKTIFKQAGNAFNDFNESTSKTLGMIEERTMGLLKKKDGEKYQMAQLTKLQEMEQSGVLTSSDMEIVSNVLLPFSSEDFDVLYYVDQVFDEKKVNSRKKKSNLQMKNRFQNMQTKMKDNLNLAKRFTKKKADEEADDSEDDSDGEDHELQKTGSATGLVASVAPKQAKPAKSKKPHKFKISLKKKNKSDALEKAAADSKKDATSGHDAKNIMKNMVHTLMDKEEQERLHRTRKKNTKTVALMKNISQEQLNVLKLYRQAIAHELQREVNGHYTLFINTSKAVDYMEKEWGELSELVREISHACQVIKQWDDHEINNRMKKLKPRPQKSENEEDDSSEDALSALQEINCELVAALYTQRIDYAMELFAEGVTHANKLTDLNSSVLKQVNDNKERILSKQGSVKLEDAFQKFVNKQDEEEEEAEKTQEELQYEQLISVVQKYHDLCAELQNLMLSEIKMKRNWTSIQYYRSLVHNLTLMDARNDAVVTYLNTQQQLIHESLSAITGMTGDPLTYASILSRRFFRLVHESTQRYQGIFMSGDADSDQDFAKSSEFHHASGYVKWLVKQITDEFCRTFKDQVFTGCSNDFRIIAPCCDLAFQQADTLKNDGIMLTYIVQDNFRETIALAIESFVWKYEDELNEKIGTESWMSTEVAGQELMSFTRSMRGSAVVTETGKILFRFCDEFAHLLKPVVSTQLYQTTVSHLKRVFEHYLVSVFKVVSKGSLNDHQYFSTFCSIHSVLGKLLPRMTEEMQSMFGQAIPELQSLAAKTKDFETKLLNKYCDIRAMTIYSILNIHEPAYPKQNRKGVQTVNDIQVSPSFRGMVTFLSKLNRNLEQYTNNMKKADTILPTLLERLVYYLSKQEGEFWKRLKFNPNLPVDQNSDDEEEEEEQKGKTKTSPVKKQRKKASSSDSDNSEDSDKDSDEESETKSDSEEDDSESKSGSEEESDSESDKPKQKSNKNAPQVKNLKVQFPLTEIDINTIVLDLRFLIESMKYVMFSRTKLQINDLIKTIIDQYNKANRDPNSKSKSSTPEDNVSKDSNFYYDKIDDLLEENQSLSQAVKTFESSSKRSKQAVASNIGKKVESDEEEDDGDDDSTVQSDSEEEE